MVAVTAQAAIAWVMVVVMAPSTGTARAESPPLVCSYAGVGVAAMQEPSVEAPSGVEPSVEEPSYYW
jgi:hypothetical protein